MKHVIIGTAGHVDHGKSSLIRALTGLQTDRLEEEKKRGITIDLGFAWLDLPDGGKAGIVDVPGHERFVHNMLAGAGGIDLAILVVAADEGVMPQTEEHLAILDLLDIKKGLIVMTKIDLVDPEWLDLAEETVREAVAGTFFAEAPIYRASAYTGEGIEEVRQAIFQAIQDLPEKNPDLAFREPIDRVFSVEGFGTVITGTIFEGQVKVGDKLMVYPQAQEARVRSIQVHETDVDEAFAGQRTAINLAQIAKDQLVRGQVLASPNSLEVSQILDVEIRVPANSPFAIKDRSRVHFHYGAAEALCQVRLLGAGSLEPGDTGLARLNFQEDVCLKYHDPFVLRFFSPVVTVGGGHVLDPCPRTFRIKNAAWQQRLQELREGDEQTRLLLALDSGSPHFDPLTKAVHRAGLDQLTPQALAQVCHNLVEDKLAYKLTDQIYLSTAFLHNLCASCVRILGNFHQAQPLKAGMRREALRTTLLSDVRLDYTDKILDYLLAQGMLKEQAGLISLPNFNFTLTSEQEKIQAAMLAQYQKAGFSPPENAELLAQFNKQDRPEDLLSNLIDRGDLVRLDDKLNLHPDFLAEAKAYVISEIEAKGSLKLADFRDHINSSRKYAVAILDYFDRIKLTRMKGDVRILL